MALEYKVVRITSEYLPGSINVLRKSFFSNEMVCKCTGVLSDSEILEETEEYKLTKSSKELEDLCLDCVKDGVSFCCVNVKTNEVLGVTFNKIQVKPLPGEQSYFDKFADENIKDGPALALVDFMVKVDSQFDIFENFETDCFFEIMFLGALTEFKGRGVGQSVVQASIELAQQMKNKNSGVTPDIDIESDAKEFENSEALKKIPKVVTAIFTSRFSQKIGQRVGMKPVLDIPYTEFEYNGKQYIETTGQEHPSCQLCCRKLD